MDRTEAQRLAQAELAKARSLGYDKLRGDAPTPAPKSEQPPWPFRRWTRRWDPKPRSHVRKEIRGESGTVYQVVREIDWDDDVEGALRIWALVDDVTSAAEPEVGDDLVYPPENLMMEGQADKLSPEQRQKWWQEAGRWQLRQLLFWRWDPIGVNDAFPFTADEYDSYADPIASLLGREADVDEVAAFLRGVEEDAMGLGRGDGSGDHCREVAQLVAEWHRNSISHWLAR